MIPFPPALTKLPPWSIFLVAGVLAYVKTLWRWCYDHTIGYAVTKMSISLMIEESEHREAYRWLACWSEKHLRKQRVSSLLLQMRGQGSEGAPIEPGEPVSYSMVPSYGAYYLLWHRRLTQLFHHKEEVPGNMRPRRTIEVLIWGTRNRQMLFDILKEAREEYESQTSETLTLYTSDGYSWDPAPLPQRPVDTLYLPPTQLDEIMTDLRTWIRHEAAYKALSIPYQRGYLFYGPPGTGKSSLVKVLGSEFKLPVYVVTLDRMMTGVKLNDLLFNVKTPAIVLLEDVDCISAAHSREMENDAAGREGMLTLSDLLNAVDGLGSKDHRLLVMTTNHPELLDAALLRSGRIDRKWLIDYSADGEIRRFYNKASHYFPVPDWESFRSGLPRQCTVADAQARLFSCAA